MFTIRPATHDDDAALAKQFMGLNRYEEPMAQDRRTDLAGGQDGLAASWREVKASDGAALVAVQDGAVIGHMFLVFKTEPPYIRPEFHHYAYISELYVREGVRGAGVGAALLAEAEKIAAARGVPRIFLGVLAGNPRAQALYERMGYAPYAVYLGKPVAPQSSIEE